MNQEFLCVKMPREVPAGCLKFKVYFLKFALSITQNKRPIPKAKEKSRLVRASFFR